MARTTSRAAPGSAGRASVAGTVGTPAAAAMARAETLSPSRRRVSGRGPMKAIPAAAQASANSGDSERNPYPGWIASDPVSTATPMMSSTAR